MGMRSRKRMQLRCSGSSGQSPALDFWTEAVSGSPPDCPPALNPAVFSSSLTATFQKVQLLSRHGQGRDPSELFTSKKQSRVTPSTAVRGVGGGEEVGYVGQGAEVGKEDTMRRLV